jgi:FMN phosphatase YigB (HAD superfamily)
VLRQFEVGADAAPYVELFFQVTTAVELHPETREVLHVGDNDVDDVKGAKEAASGAPRSRLTG